jgi:GNAT superfamily N-acetyltransferase
MGVIREVLDDAPPPHAFVLRPPGPGDYGWIVHRHGVRYAEEYDWDETMEALVARIVADYVERADHRREAAWIAEIDGEPVGCVLCVAKTDAVAQLRLLLVEPRARGRGIGARLIDECLRFARRAGYEEITLWTNDVLHDARRLYERAGFELVESGPHHSFGHDLVEQTWSRRL